MSTGINIAPSSDITVGTTAVTSGTDGRVFFQAGGVVQQDANFTYDNTLKRLGLKAVGTAATDIPFVVQNSAGTSNVSEFRGNGVGVVCGVGTARAFFSPYNAHGGDGFMMTTQDLAVNGTPTKAAMFMTEGYINMYGTSGVQSLSFAVDATYGGTTRQWQFSNLNLNDGALYLGTGNSATNNRRLFITDSATLNIGKDTMGNVNSGTNQLRILNGTAPSALAADTFALYSADRGGVAGKASAHFRAEDGTINVLGDLSGIGTSTPGARLDVRSQGALSTDIAFRVRNSADSVTLQQFNGDGSWLHRNNANTFYEYFDGTSRIEYRRVGSVELGTNNDVTQFRFMCNVGDVAIRGGTNLLNIVNNNNFHFEESTGLLPTSGAGCIVMKNRTAPSTNVQDRFYLYSADIIAGNAAPHFRTENGSIVKLYQETTGVAAATLVGGGGTTITDTDTFGGYTLQQIAQALKNLGILQ